MTKFQFENECCGLVDGTGVGKGRALAGIYLDNRGKKRGKAAWFSSSMLLMADAQRDLKDVMGTKNYKEKLVFKIPHNYDPITEKEGMLFTTYSTLSGKQSKKDKKDRGMEVDSGSDDSEGIDQGSNTRLSQIINWLGTGFDGLVKSHINFSIFKQ